MLVAILTLLIVLVLAAGVLAIAWLGTGVRQTAVPVRWARWGRKAADYMNGDAQIGQPAPVETMAGSAQR